LYYLEKKNCTLCVHLILFVLQQRHAVVQYVGSIAFSKTACDGQYKR